MLTREQLEQQLRKLIIGCPGRNEGSCPFCHCDCDGDVAAAMALIDQYAAGLQNPPVGDVEEWDANQAAQYLGLSSAAAARSTLSRWGIKRIRQEQEHNGRPMAALYPAEAIRARGAARPKRGNRVCDPNTPT